MTATTVETILEDLASGVVIPYLGAGVLALAGEDCPLPASPEVLVDRLTAKASVPHKIRKNLTAAAQFIENFKHRKTVVKAMTEAFSADVPPTALHRTLASIPSLKLLVHAWYDDLPQKALAGARRLGHRARRQPVPAFRHLGSLFFRNGERRDAAEANSWMPLLYQPLGSVSPAANFLVSDSDFVEVLTEIDIQTPIPEAVQNIRKGRSFLFLGCRFSTQIERAFPQQIMKRSSDRHWAVLPEEPTRNEAKFMELYNIERIAMPLAEFAALLTGESVSEPAALAS